MGPRRRIVPVVGTIIPINITIVDITSAPNGDDFERRLKPVPEVAAVVRDRPSIPPATSQVSRVLAGAAERSSYQGRTISCHTVDNFTHDYLINLPENMKTND